METCNYLNNDYQAPIVYDGVYYLNNTAAYLAQMCMTKKEKREFEGMTADEARAHAENVRVRFDWYDVKEQCMEAIIRTKFRQLPMLAIALLNEDKERILAEDCGEKLLKVRNDLMSDLDALEYGVAL